MIALSRGVRCSIARSRTSRISTRSSSGSGLPICSAMLRLSEPSPLATGWSSDRGMEFLEAPRKADGGALVAEVPFDLSGDGERREGCEFESKVRVEALDG